MSAAAFSEWVIARQGMAHASVVAAGGVERHSKPIFGWVLTEPLPGALSLHIASEGGYLARQALAGQCGRSQWAKDALQAARDLNARRVSATVPGKKSTVLQCALQLGFKPEGIVRCAFPDDDLYLFGMLQGEIPCHL